VVVNGGITTSEQVQEQLLSVDGVMVGREAYHNPWWLASWDAAWCDAPPPTLSREQVEVSLCDYMAREAAQHGTPWSTVARHMLGLRNGLAGARRWRQVWSDHRLRDHAPHDVMQLAHAASDCLAPSAQALDA
jgi:tRNA-dihydrouridine synthase A